MRLTARISAGTHLARMWTDFGRSRGQLHGLEFRKEGNDFVSGEVPSEIVDALNHIPSVRLELMAIPLPDPPLGLEAVLSPIEDADSVVADILAPKARGRPRKKGA